MLTCLFDQAYALSEVRGKVHTHKKTRTIHVWLLVGDWKLFHRDFGANLALPQLWMIFFLVVGFISFVVLLAVKSLVANKEIPNIWALAFAAVRLPLQPAPSKD